ncbi:MAG: Z1 domain-containing protein [Methanoregula sp.]|nr:Z1 domain-containing protein [Methanoregula sp.]
MNFEEALGLVRRFIDLKISRDDAINNPLIPYEFRARILEQLEKENIITLEPAHVIDTGEISDDWLKAADRSGWYYWTSLRQFWLDQNGWSQKVVQSVDDATDRILAHLPHPSSKGFNIQGLVLGYVQSGKTANYTALIAKATDAGYRLIIVLSGIDNSLRLQTQIRLKHELVGYSGQGLHAVPLPPTGKQWIEFTREEIKGDFKPGYANPAVLQGSQPVLLVIKKNGTVLRRLISWLDKAPDESLQSIPVLVIDDEADQASIDTTGTYQTEDHTDDREIDDPSTINKRIRQILQKFRKSAYVAYTATPFANILIPHDTYHPEYTNDLYPKDFIIDLPKPHGYYGAEELFGISENPNTERRPGLDILRPVKDEDLYIIDQGGIPVSLLNALHDYILAGAARAFRGQGDKPATMLVHTSHLIGEQRAITEKFRQSFNDLRDEWRYQRKGLRDTLKDRWEKDFRKVIHARHPDLDVSYESIETFIGTFLESVQVKTINSETGHVLDYQSEPGLKAVAIGGNKLSRGLTIEGLLVSYFVRSSNMYDTLMQMGRWFGFRQGYEDLTRIYTTPDLMQDFSDLAFVEQQIREDIQIYEDERLTPLQVGVRIRSHPTMIVTSRLKSRFAKTDTISQSYSDKSTETVKFPMSRVDILKRQEEANLIIAKNFLSDLGTPNRDDKKGPIWSGVSAVKIISFMKNYQILGDSGEFSPSLIIAYIEKQSGYGELIKWTVAVRGRGNPNEKLGAAEWGIKGGAIWQISRTRIKGTDRLGVISESKDETVGLSDDQLAAMELAIRSGKKNRKAARAQRPKEEGLMLLYPISRYSGYDEPPEGNRTSLFENPDDSITCDLLGLAFSFPKSEHPQPVVEYISGTVEGR